MNKNNKNKIKRRRSFNKGGATCGPQGCPIAPYSMRSGGIRKRKTLKKRKGKLGGGVPLPFVGKPWTWDLWPGQGTSVINHSNHYSLNTYPTDPQLAVKIGDESIPRFGGKSKRNKPNKLKRHIKSKRKINKTVKRGGVSLFQNAINGYRDVAYNVDSAYSALRGINPPINPLPYKDQLTPR